MGRKTTLRETYAALLEGLGDNVEAKAWVVKAFSHLDDEQLDRVLDIPWYKDAWWTASSAAGRGFSFLKNVIVGPPHE